MADLDFNVFRPRGLGQASPSTHIPEADPALDFLDVIDDTGLVSGWYKFQLAIDFEVPTGKHLDIVVTVNGTSGKTYRLVSHVTAPLVNDFLITFIVPLGAPSNAINCAFSAEFPDQSGASEAIIDAYQFTYEKWVDL